jgi:hypothetical protein
MELFEQDNKVTLLSAVLCVLIKISLNVYWFPLLSKILSIKPPGVKWFDWGSCA